MKEEKNYLWEIKRLTLGDYKNSIRFTGCKKGYLYNKHGEYMNEDIESSNSKWYETYYFDPNI